MTTQFAGKTQPFSEVVEVSGHIIDSLILPKVLDLINAAGAEYEMGEVRIGHSRRDPSFARLTVFAPTAEILERALSQITPHGAIPPQSSDCEIQAADMAGAFPEGFYCTTNEETEVRIGGKWIPVADQEMDVGIVVDPTEPTARCLPMGEVQPGEMVVIGRKGTRVFPVGRDLVAHDAFSFMNSAVSSEKPKHLIVRDIAQAMRTAKAGNGRILIVGGPAIVHTGSRDHLSWLIEQGYVQVLFAGNALATHDIEQSLFGTSLGISMTHGGSCHEGHEHHLRTINRIRRLGSIRAAVDQGVLTSGIMYQCVRQGIPYLLAGSIRDDGPLPDVVTDTQIAQAKMREMARGVTFCLMIATTLHSIAVGNLLPARVKVVCVDINPATVTKLNDRGSFQTIGMVTDVEPFLRILVEELSGG